MEPRVLGQGHHSPNVPSRGRARRQVRKFQDEIQMRAYDGDQPLRRLFVLASDPATLAFAFDRLVGRYGDRVPGIDRQTFKQVERTIGRDAFVADLSNELLNGDYKPAQTRELQIGDRAVFIQTVRDRVVEYATKSIIDPLAEASYHPQSFGWRRGTGATNAIWLIKRTGWRFDWAVNIDVEDCFGSPPHKVVMRSVRTIIADDRMVALIRGWIGNGKYPNRGVGAGTILSDLLANLALTPIDNLFSPNVYSCSPLDGRPAWLRSRGHTGLVGLQYLRYGDDIVVLGKTDQVQPVKILQILQQRLERLGLTISWNKSAISDLTEGFDFLGHRITKRFIDGKHRIVTEPKPQRVDEIVDEIALVLTPLAISRELADGDDPRISADIGAVLQRRLQYFKETGSDLGRLESRVMELTEGLKTVEISGSP